MRPPLSAGNAGKGNISSSTLQPLAQRASAAVSKAPNTDQAERELTALIAKEADEWQSSPTVRSVLEVPANEPLGPMTSVQSDEEAARLDRRLQQGLRALKREVNGRGSEAAIKVLANDSIRLLIQVAGYRRLAELSRSLFPGGRQKPAGDAAQVETARQLLTLLKHPENAERFPAIATLAFAPAAVAATSGAEAAHAPLNEAQRAALFDVLTTLDPTHGTVVREKLANGADPRELGHLLVERLMPVSLDQSAQVEEADPEKAKAAGLKFDLSLNKWVPNDLSWSYKVSLGDLLSYHIERPKKRDDAEAEGTDPEYETIMEGPEQLQERLEMMATDPSTGEQQFAPETIRRFVDNLSAAAATENEMVRRVLDRPIDLTFSTTEGGDVPLGGLWELTPEMVADLFDALNTPEVVSAVEQEAAAARKALAQRVEKVRAELGDLLDRYPGIPRRHKRTHGALINIGLAPRPQRIATIGREDGILPRSKTVLEPETLRKRFADVEEIKLRYLFTSIEAGFEMITIDDAFFNEVSKKEKCTPNHELLSYNNKIAGSGYVVISKGTIVELEDDIEMLPGKMPAHLPPALEVLRLRGYSLDEDRIRASAKVVLDWAQFAKLAKEKPSADLGPPPDAEVLHQTLEDVKHAERPAIVVNAIRSKLAAERAAGGTETEIRARTAEWLVKALDGANLINTSAEAFRSGDLPQAMNDFGKFPLSDRTFADCLVKKVAS